MPFRKPNPAPVIFWAIPQSTVILLDEFDKLILCKKILTYGLKRKGIKASHSGVITHAQPRKQKRVRSN